MPAHDEQSPQQVPKTKEALQYRCKISATQPAVIDAEMHAWLGLDSPHFIALSTAICCGMLPQATLSLAQPGAINSRLFAQACSVAISLAVAASRDG